VLIELEHLQPIDVRVNCSTLTVISDTLIDS
jgi:hypothetical protein